MIESESIDLFSEEEFPDKTFEIGRTVISNYYNSKETIIDYSKIPADIFNDDSKFRATPTSLNNKLVFIAINNNFGEHQPDKDSRKKFCELSPVCNIGWSKGDEITKVLILDSDNHPRTGEEVWGCRHHAIASIDGVKLQAQRYDHHRPATKPQTSEGSGTRGEDRNDTVVADRDAGGVKGDKKKVKNIKKKKGSEEEEDMYDRIKKIKKKKQ